MKNWDIGDWALFMVVTCCALVLLSGAATLVYSALDDDREQKACKHAGGTIEYLPIPHSRDWTCKKSNALEYSP